MAYQNSTVPFEKMLLNFISNDDPIICCKIKVDKVAKQNSPPGQKLNPH